MTYGFLKRRRRKLRALFEISLDIATERASAALNTVSIWPLSVIEGLELSPQNGAVVMSGIQKFDLREWMVPQILVPLVLGLIIAGAVIVRW